MQRPAFDPVKEAQRQVDHLVAKNFAQCIQQTTAPNFQLSEMVRKLVTELDHDRPRQDWRSKVIGHCLEICLYLSPGFAAGSYGATLCAQLRSSIGACAIGERLNQVSMMHCLSLMWEACLVATNQADGVFRSGQEGPAMKPPSLTGGTGPKKQHSLTGGKPREGKVYGKKNPCHAFQKGECKFGDKCRYAHVLVADKPDASEGKSEAAEQPGVAQAAMAAAKDSVPESGAAAQAAFLSLPPPQMAQMPQMTPTPQAPPPSFVPVPQMIGQPISFAPTPAAQGPITFIPTAPGPQATQ